MKEQMHVIEQSLEEEILSGLKRNRKRLPSKYFYDERGSKLFERITELEEYYLTRTELSILRVHIREIAESIGPGALLIEPGSGSSKKTRLLLDELLSLAGYIPVDISKEYLQKTAELLNREYPRLAIYPVCADYTEPFDLPEFGASYRREVIFFPGSTIGNFEPEQASRFIQRMATMTGEKAALLIGADLKKDPSVLEAAYNDAEGVTAQFNKNLLVRLNREFNAGFDPALFRHHAFYNEEKGRIEMHLVSEYEQEVRVAGETIPFEEGETIHTENSYKYSMREFERLAADWFSVEKVWTDTEELFSLQYLSK